MPPKTGRIIDIDTICDADSDRIENLKKENAVLKSEVKAGVVLLAKAMDRINDFEAAARKVIDTIPTVLMRMAKLEAVAWAAGKVPPFCCAMDECLNSDDAGCHERLRKALSALKAKP